MSANETYDLAVRLRGEGIDEAEEGLDGVGDQFDETADNVGDSADDMEGFASKWQGAMGAIVAGIAVAAAGLLSQVPVVGGLMEGLVAIIEAVAFQMDQVLRPILQPVADAFFEIADAIFNAEGPLGTLIGIVGTVIAVLAGLAIIGKIIGFFSGLAAIWGVLVTIGQIVVTAVAAIAGILGLPVVAVAALIAAIVALVAVFATDFMGIRSTVADVLTGVVEAIVSFTATITDLFLDFIADAFEWGKDLILNFKDGILDVASAPVDAAQDVIDGVTDAIGFDVRANDRMAERWGTDLLTHFSVGMERGAQLADVNIAPSGTGGDDGRTGGTPASRTQPIENHMDGRRVDDVLRRRRGNPRRARQRDGT